jgi:hypothetical protein
LATQYPLLNYVPGVTSEGRLFCWRKWIIKHS